MKKKTKIDYYYTINKNLPKFLEKKIFKKIKNKHIYYP